MQDLMWELAEPLLDFKQDGVSEENMMQQKKD